MTITERITKLLEALCNGFLEREPYIQLGFLASVVGAPLYICGKPASGKSLIASRLTAAYKNPRILKAGRHQQKFPEKLSDFDIIIFQSFNSSDEVTKENIHTAIYDRKDAALILTGDQRPETALNNINASDHIVLSMSLPESLSPKALCSILQDQTMLNEPKIPDELVLTREEQLQWMSEIKNVTLSEDTLAIIGKLAEICDKHDIYVPIHKWIALTNIVKATAFFNGRTSTRFTDTLFLGTPIWGKASADTIINENFGNVVQSVLLKNVAESIGNPFDAAANNTKVKNLLHRSNNLYETKMFNNEPCLHYRITISGEATPLYVPLRYVETDEDFHPFNELKQVESRVRCNYHGTSNCSISIDPNVKGTGLRTSVKTNNPSTKFEDYAKMPSYVLREDDPEICAKKKEELAELKKETDLQLERQTKLLLAIRDIYRANKEFRTDLFCNLEIYDKIQNNLREIFETVSATANIIKETTALFAEVK